MYLLLYCFWVILNGRLTAEVLLLGLFVVAGVGLLSWVLFDYTPRREWRIVRKLPLFIVYVFVLLWEILKANWTMIGVIVSAKSSIEPTLVTYRTGLKTGFGRFILANSITLTPGTITVRMDGDRLTVHCLRRSMLDTSPDSVFERWIRRLEAES